MNKYDFITAFINGKYAKASNLICTGDTVINYSAEIARILDFDKKIAEVNVKKYSRPTTKNQNMIKRMLLNNGFTVKEYK